MDPRGNVYGIIKDLVAESARFAVPYRGVVVNVEDPEGRGRVKCSVPELGWVIDSACPWCEPEYVNDGISVPRVDDVVKVWFMAANPAAPYYGGRLGEIKGQKPTEYSRGKRVPWQSPDGDAPIVYDETTKMLDVVDGGKAAARLDDATKIDLTTDSVNLPLLIAVCAIFGMTLTPPILGKISTGSNKVRIG